MSSPPSLDLGRVRRRVMPRLPVDRARRMRMLATGMLVAMAALFLVARSLRDVHPAWGFVLAFAEAAMVGGLADWFAVTALFRHPLGLPIPHTAIIPENKDRIADTMASFLRENFLIPEVVARRLAHMNLAGAAGSFLIEPGGGESRIRAGAASLFADILESLDHERLGGMAKGALRSQLDRLDLAPLLGNLLTAAIADRRHMPVMENLIHWAARALEENEPLIREMIGQRANAIMRWTKLDGKLANGILDGLYKLLAETLVIEDHPLRRKLEEGLDSLAHDLLHDPKMQARVEKMKQEVIANPAFGAWLDGLWERARAGLLRAARSPDSALSGQLGASIAELGRALQRNPQLQTMLNRFARRTIVGIANRYGGQIVQLVSETVRRWDARTVTDRIEGAVGRDLQFIRINGTVVGGLVGIVIHTVELWL